MILKTELKKNYDKQLEEIINLLFSRVPSLIGYSAEVKAINFSQVLDDFELENRLNGNLAFTMNERLYEISELNYKLLVQIRKEIQNQKDR